MGENGAKNLSNEVNMLKGPIDKMAGELEAMRSKQDQTVSPDGIPVIDEQEFELIRSLKAKKKSYQTKFHTRKMVKNEVSYLKSLVKQSKLKLCSNFLEWYRKSYGNFMIESTENEATAEKEGEEDVLDDGEQFENLEKQRILEENPDSLAFFNARKTMMATMKRKKLRMKK